MADQFFLSRNGKVTGPVSSDAVKKGIGNGKVLATDYVSEADTGPWKPIGDVPALAKLIPAPEYTHDDDTHDDDTHTVVSRDWVQVLFDGKPSYDGLNLPSGFDDDDSHDDDTARKRLTRPAQLPELRQVAGNRYASLVFYQTLCHVFSGIMLALGGIGFVISAITADNIQSVVPLVYGLIALVFGVWSFFMFKVIANLILAIVDVAVNSHLQVHLQSERD